WRCLIFDLPESARTRRRELSLWLREKRFGRLQGSAWVAPTFPDSWSSEIERLALRPGEATFMVGEPGFNCSDSSFVAAAWDFAAIRRAYQEHMDFLARSSEHPAKEWTAAETRLWRRAFAADPFLPDALLPADYLGKTAFAARRRAYLARL